MKKYFSLLLCFLLSALITLTACALTEDGEGAEADTTAAVLFAEDDPEDASAAIPERESYTLEEITDADTLAATETAQKETATPVPVTSAEDTAKTVTAATSAAVDTAPPKKEPAVQTASADTEKALPEELTYITEGGTYTLSGEKTNVTVTVDAGDADVQLILNGVTVRNDKGPAIFVKSADNVEIVLAKGTVNRISDGASYTVLDGETAVDGAIFSKSDLSLSGEGILYVDGNQKHGIVSKDDLVIKDGVIDIISRNVGLNGKDCVIIDGGSITINSGTDGIRSKNLEDSTRGYVKINGGSLNITSGNDGVQASSTLDVAGGTVLIKSGRDTIEDGSYKGLKADGDVNICGGVCRIHAKDDAVHSDTRVTVTGGELFGAGVSGAKQGFLANGRGVLVVKTDDRIAKTPVNVQSASGDTVCEFVPEFDYSVIVIINEKIISGEKYTVTVDSQSGSFTAK